MDVTSPSEQLLFSTVRIECDVANGTSTGTAFGLVHSVNNSNCMFLVTNKHVIRDAIKGRLRFIRA